MIVKEVYALLTKIKQNAHDKDAVLRFVTELEVLINGNLLADGASLRQVLQAFLGPIHYTAELHVLRNLPDSPVNKLVQQFNSQAS